MWACVVFFGVRMGQRMTEISDTGVRGLRHEHDVQKNLIRCTSALRRMTINFFLDFDIVLLTTSVDRV